MDLSSVGISGLPPRPSPATRAPAIVVVVVVGRGRSKGGQLGSRGAPGAQLPGHDDRAVGRSGLEQSCGREINGVVGVEWGQLLTIKVILAEDVTEFTPFLLNQGPHNLIGFDSHPLRVVFKPGVLAMEDQFGQDGSG